MTIMSPVLDTEPLNVTYSTRRIYFNECVFQFEISNNGCRNFNPIPKFLISYKTRAPAISTALMYTHTIQMLDSLPTSQNISHAA
jgi:hypothetical protein